jgi:hypothetical protein
MTLIRRYTLPATGGSQSNAVLVERYPDRAIRITNLSHLLDPQTALEEL